MMSYIRVKNATRIIRLIEGTQTLNNGGTFVLPNNNREIYKELIRNFGAFDLFTKEDIHFLCSHSNLIPFVREHRGWNMERSSYSSFHANRIVDTLNGQPTPSNDYNDGITNYGELSFNLHNRKQTVVSSLREIGIIPRNAVDYFIEYFRHR